MLEKDIENRLKQEVESRGGLALKFVSPGMRGVPDRLLLLPDGMTVFVELKQKGKRLSPLQQKCAERFKALGHEVHLVDSMDVVQDLIQYVFDDR